MWIEIWRLRDVRRDAAKYPMAQHINWAPYVLNVPYYDQNGKLKGWVREEQEEIVFQTQLLTGTTLPQRLSPRLPSHLPATAAVPHPDGDENLPEFTLTSWDGFPDHRFRCHFTRQEVEDTSRLAFYWISDKRPGRRGSPDAITAEKGKLSRYKCAGIIECKAVVCTVQIAPGQNVARQLEALCTCGSSLRHRSCEVEWSVVFYRNGAIFENSGAHTHSKYTHFLPTLKNKKMLQLQEFIAKQPIVLRGSQRNINGMSVSDDSHIREEEVEAVDSDADEEHDSNEEVNVDNSGDEERLDPEADQNKDEL
ncbi:hypothetical protein B0H11DRAFT_1912901 [Mycena galericulata]|nr:hypothetical protein B0H11DRAFT_1934498 [Mycena galericulata]KAJ7488750.1 hypothetical protein B0H11DRAFT_1912901 [Mycena galericulata]